MLLEPGAPDVGVAVKVSDAKDRPTHLTRLAQRANVLEDVIPGSTFVGVGMIIRKALLEEFPLPLVQGQIACRFGHVGPESTNIVHLFVNAQLVEPRRRNAQRIPHALNIYPHPGAEPPRLHTFGVQTYFTSENDTGAKIVGQIFDKYRTRGAR